MQKFMVQLNILTQLCLSLDRFTIRILTVMDKCFNDNGLDHNDIFSKMS